MTEPQRSEFAYCELIKIAESRLDDILAFPAGGTKKAFAAQFDIPTSRVRDLLYLAGRMVVVKRSAVGAGPLSETDLIEVFSSEETPIDKLWLARHFAPPDRPDGTWSPWLVAAHVGAFRQYSSEFIRLPILLADIQDLEFSVRVNVHLRLSGVFYVAQLAKLSRAELLRIPFIGTKACSEIHALLKHFGLDLEMLLPYWDDSRIIRPVQYDRRLIGG